MLSKRNTMATTATKLAALLVLLAPASLLAGGYGGYYAPQIENRVTVITRQERLLAEHPQIDYEAQLLAQQVFQEVTQAVHVPVNRVEFRQHRFSQNIADLPAQPQPQVLPQQGVVRQKYYTGYIQQQFILGGHRQHGYHH